MGILKIFGSTKTDFTLAPRVVSKTGWFDSPHRGHVDFVIF